VWGKARISALARAVGLAGTALMAFEGIVTVVMILRRRHTLFRATWVMDFDTGKIHTSVLETVRLETSALWLAVFLLLAAGRWRAGRVLATVLALIAASGVSGLRGILVGQTALVVVITVALFTARGEHARPVRVRGFVAATALVGVTGIMFAGFLGIWHDLWFPVARLAGGPDGLALFVLGTILVAVVCLLGFRSAVWPVALAVVGSAILGPTLAAQLVTPANVSISGPALLVECGLIAIAGLAVLKERRATRGERLAAVS